MELRMCEVMVVYTLMSTLSFTSVTGSMMVSAHLGAEWDIPPYSCLSPTAFVFDLCSLTDTLAYVRGWMAAGNWGRSLASIIFAQMHSLGGAVETGSVSSSSPFEPLDPNDDTLSLRPNRNLGDDGRDNGRFSDCASRVLSVKSGDFWAPPVGLGLRGGRVKSSTSFLLGAFVMVVRLEPDLSIFAAGGSRKYTSVSSMPRTLDRMDLFSRSRHFSVSSLLAVLWSPSFTVGMSLKSSRSWPRKVSPLTSNTLILTRVLMSFSASMTKASFHSGLIVFSTTEVRLLFLPTSITQYASVVPCAALAIRFLALHIFTYSRLLVGFSVPGSPLVESELPLRLNILGMYVYWKCTLPPDDTSTQKSWSGSVSSGIGNSPTPNVLFPFRTKWSRSDTSNCMVWTFSRSSTSGWFQKGSVVFLPVLLVRATSWPFTKSSSMHSHFSRRPRASTTLMVSSPVCVMVEAMVTTL
eukprot:comp19419_c0_seq1/m.22504 comp19419_c0_seq1/g.22504  ORF comp19419_c0_seq1/g.22504 comp19419_c0_seq1/m.22504 type:complete len:466 (+) comp19419_c0_seq1:1303-2700(+)